MDKCKQILITGGAGFIGSELAIALKRRGHRVRILDNLSPQIHGNENSFPKKLRSLFDSKDLIIGDVRSRNDFLKAIVGIDTVVHLAAETGTGQSMYAIQHYTDVNIGGIATLLDIISNQCAPLTRIVLASSRAIYGEGKYVCSQHGVTYPDARKLEALRSGCFDHFCNYCKRKLIVVPTDELTLLSPGSVYGVTKLTQEYMLLAVAKAKNISAISLRYQNVFGPGQSLLNPYTGILSIFTSRLREGKTINIFEDGLEMRDFVFIDDVIEATIKGIEVPEPIVDVFNVGSGKGETVASVAQRLCNLIGSNSNLNISGDFRMGDIRHNYADLTKIESVLGYRPVVTFDDGLQRFVEWACLQNKSSDFYEKSLDELKLRGLLSP